MLLKDKTAFLKNGPWPASFFFIFIFSIQLTVNNVQYKFCQWLESNRRPLALEATALPTEPKQLPYWTADVLFQKFDFIQFNSFWKLSSCWAGALPSLVVTAGDSIQEFMGSNPSSGYWSFFIFCKKYSVCLFVKTGNKRNRGRGWPI